MSALSILAILVVLVSLAVVDARMLPAAPWARSVLISLACAATGIVSWLLLAPAILPDVAEPLFLPVAALAGVASYLATIAARASGRGVVVVLLFGAIWSLLVYVPTAIRTFIPFIPNWSLGISPIDHGGSLPVNVASGAAVLGVLLCGGARLRTASVRRRTGLLGVIGLAAGWIVWLAGAEFAIDDMIGAIIINGLVSASGGVVGWLSCSADPAQVGNPQLGGRWTHQWPGGRDGWRSTLHAGVGSGSRHPRRRCCLHLHAAASERLSPSAVVHRGHAPRCRRRRRGGPGAAGDQHRIPVHRIGHPGLQSGVGHCRRDGVFPGRLGRSVAGTTVRR